MPETLSAVAGELSSWSLDVQRRAALRHAGSPDRAFSGGFAPSAAGTIRRDRPRVRLEGPAFARS